MGIPGEELSKVSHYFKEGHPYFNQHVLVIGGKNSAIDAALELHKAGAYVTVAYRGSEYSQSIKPWILPEFDALARNGEITMKFETQVLSIEEGFVTLKGPEGTYRLENDFLSSPRCEQAHMYEQGAVFCERHRGNKQAPDFF